MAGKQKEVLIPMFADNEIVTGTNMETLIESTTSDIQNVNSVEVQCPTVPNLFYRVRRYSCGLTYWYRGILENRSGANLVLPAGEYEIGKVSDFPEIARLTYSDEMGEVPRTITLTKSTGVRSFQYANNISVQLRDDGIFLRCESPFTMVDSSTQIQSVIWSAMRSIWRSDDVRP